MKSLSTFWVVNNIAKKNAGFGCCIAFCQTGALRWGLTSALLHLGGARLGHLDGALALGVEQRPLQGS